MVKSEEYLVGVVLVCPITNTQIAVHKNLVTFAFWDAGLAGFELDITLDKCPVCEERHIMSLPLEIKS